VAANTPIVISDLAFRYLTRTDWALEGVSLEVFENEFLGITGPSGAGKSTLCLSLNGLVPNVIEGTMRGRVVVGGFDTRQTAVSQISNIVGVVFQDPRSQLTGSAMTVEEEVAFGLQNLGVPRSLMRDRIREALDVVGLQGFEMRAPFELSGGEQQRLSLATVLAMQPKIMVLDEPTELLDPEGVVSVMEAINSINEKYRMTTFLVSNQPEILVQYANRIVVISAGKIKSTDSPQQFSRKVRFVEELGVPSTQVAKVASLLDENGLWKGSYPLNESQAAESIRKQIFGD
jgi:energy-coupling factor transport system ATP-binding protein